MRLCNELVDCFLTTAGNTTDEAGACISHSEPLFHNARRAQVHDQKGTGPPAREGKPDVRSHCTRTTRPPTIFSQGDMRLLAVAINRALQRRLGDIPSPADVHKVVNKLTNDGAKPSAFVRHATRVQEELARLHARIQFERDQERQDHAIASIQDPPIMSSIRPRKRSAGHDDDDDSTYLAQEAKRVRLDNTGPARLHPHAPLPTSDNKPKPPAESIPPKGMPIASRDPRVAEPRVDPVRPQASLDDSPSALPLMATEPPLSNNTISDPDSKTGQCSPSDNADGESRKNTKSLVERSDRPVPVDPSSAQTHSLVANVPGIWAIQVGKPSAGQTDVTFVVDQETASSVRRWATHRQGLK